MAISIDTLAYAKRLREAGFTERQAEGQAQALAAAMSDSLATKQDLRELEVRIDARFDTLEARLEGRFEAIDAKFEAIDRKFDAIEAKFDAIYGKFAAIDDRFAASDDRFTHLERQIDARFETHSAQFSAQLSDLERRMTTRLGGMMVAGIGVVSVLVTLT